MGDNNKTTKIHTTNYFNTFIEVADDCISDIGLIPPQKGDSQSIANIQFDLISKNPYKFTSDDVLFMVFASKMDLIADEYADARKGLFSKGQACLRSSPLTKRYGWGIHCNQDGKVAIYGVETDKYQEFQQDSSLKKVKALRSKK
jgi:hypothetical protein